MRIDFLSISNFLQRVSNATETPHVMGCHSTMVPRHIHRKGRHITFGAQIFRVQLNPTTNFFLSLSAKDGCHNHQECLIPSFPTTSNAGILNPYPCVLPAVSAGSISTLSATSKP